MRELLVLASLLSFTFSFVVERPAPLHEDEELNVEVADGKETRLFFSNRHPDGPLWMYVTPCGGVVHWRIYNADPSGGSPLPSLDGVEDVESGQLELVAGEADDRRMIYYSPHLHAERLLIVLTASSPSSARVFITLSETSLHDRYPPLPSDVTLSHTLLHSSSPNDVSSDLVAVQVSWKLPRFSTPPEEARYRFCAVVSRHEPDWAVCDRLDVGLESIHCVDQTTSSMNITRLRPGRRHFVTVFVRDSRHGSTSSFQPLEVSVPESPESLAARQLRLAARKNITAVVLPDGELRTGELLGVKGALINFDLDAGRAARRREYPPSNSSDVMRANGYLQVLLVVHSCVGYIRVSVFRNGKLLRRSDPFSGFRRFLVVNAKSGQLRFQISNDDSHEKEVRVWASGAPDSSPFAQLPDDTSIKEVARTCTSATIQWLRASNPKVRYCLYRRKEKANFLEELVSKVENLCVRSLPQEELVGCYVHRGPRDSSEDVEGLIETSISGLQPDSTYRFDLLASVLNSSLQPQELPYRTVWIKTKADC